MNFFSHEFSAQTQIQIHLHIWHTFQLEYKTPFITLWWIYPWKILWPSRTRGRKKGHTFTQLELVWCTSGSNYSCRAAPDSLNEKIQTHKTRQSLIKSILCFKHAKYFLNFMCYLALLKSWSWLESNTKNTVGNQIIICSISWPRSPQSDCNGEVSFHEIMIQNTMKMNKIYLIAQ